MLLYLNERDYLIMNEIDRWSSCSSRHVRHLAGFSGQRATDRRLKLLINAGYVERKKYLYGVPSVYFLTFKGKSLIGAPKRKDKVKIEQIVHDMNVIDTAIYFMKNKNIELNNIISEKQLHRLDGFGKRKHRPDFVFTNENTKNSVEIEMSLKAKNRLEKIIQDNFMGYDVQYWVVPEKQLQIIKVLENSKSVYTNIEILSLEGVKNYVSGNI